MKKDWSFHFLSFKSILFTQFFSMTATSRKSLLILWIISSWSHATDKFIIMSTTKSQKERILSLSLKDKKISRLFFCADLSEADSLFLNSAYEERNSLHFRYCLCYSMLGTIIVNWTAFRYRLYKQDSHRHWLKESLWLGCFSPAIFSGPRKSTKDSIS